MRPFLARRPARAVLLAALTGCASEPGGAAATDGDTGTSESGSASHSSSWTSASTTAPPGTSSTSSSSADGDPTDDGVPPDCGPAPAGSEILLIDDLEPSEGDERGDTAIPRHEGRVGWWYPFNDGSAGEQLPNDFDATDEDAHDGTWSVHTWGEGFNDWGAGLAVSLNEGNCPYDASVFRGIAFWARGEGRVRVRLPTTETTPVEYGGSCEDGCYDDFGAFIELESDWTYYTIPWTAVEQEGWGTDVAFESGHVREILWHDIAALSFDIWIDDVAFLPASVGEDTTSSTGDESSSAGEAEGKDDAGSSTSETGG